jgi:hypothetical protein
MFSYDKLFGVEQMLYRGTLFERREFILLRIRDIFFQIFALGQKKAVIFYVTVKRRARAPAKKTRVFLCQQKYIHIYGQHMLLLLYLRCMPLGALFLDCTKVGTIFRAHRRRKLLNCEAISDGAVASSKVFDVHLDFAYSSDYSSFQRGHVISNKNYNNLHVFSFDITSPKIVIFQLSHCCSRFFLNNQSGVEF